MSDLTEFLIARIAEDEAVALAPHASVRAERLTDMERIEYDDDRGYARLGIGRVLAECEAKRRIVEFHRTWPVLVERSDRHSPRSTFAPSPSTRSPTGSPHTRSGSPSRST